MLLKALGYFQYSADFGSDWLVETTKNGSTAGLFGRCCHRRQGGPDP